MQNEWTKRKFLPVEAHDSRYCRLFLSKFSNKAIVKKGLSIDNSQHCIFCPESPYGFLFGI